MVLQVTGHEMGFQSETYVHDAANVLAMRKLFKVETMAQVNTTVVIQVVGRIRCTHAVKEASRTSTFLTTR